MKQRIVILGGGESGIGAALLAASKGLEVFVSDHGTIDAGRKQSLKAKGIKFEEGRHTKDLILSAAEIVKGPGISPDIELLQDARALGIPIIDEIELAARYTEAKKILITGTNGKTTTTSLLEHLLIHCGFNAKAVGNIGKSFSSELLVGDRDVFVIECSSFQLDGIKELKATAGILLNITPDHMNRYGNMDSYIASKMHITDLIDTDGLMVYNLDDKNIDRSSLKPGAKSISISQIATAYLEGTSMRFEREAKGHEIDTHDVSLKGRHNYMNIMATVLVCRYLNCEMAKVREGLKTFKSVEHRLEFINTVNSVSFINDSKATNVDAVYYALESFETPLVWIAGGVDKGNDYQMIEGLVQEKVHSLVCLGTNNEPLLAAFTEKVKHIRETNSMKDAVRAALEYANKFDTVLLSPACASFDLFDNYEDRGNQFRASVNDLKREFEKGVLDA